MNNAILFYVGYLRNVFKLSGDRSVMVFISELFASMV